jgi:uncharacterized protein (DUF1697 family)
VWHPTAVARKVALLRGINVGAGNRLSMARLRELMEGLGYEGVETLLQSGNVAFAAGEPAAESERRIAGALREQDGLEVPVLVRTRAQLAAVVKRDPLREQATNPKAYHVVFLSQRPDAKRVREVDPERYRPELFEQHGREIFVWWPDGAHRARLTHSFWERKLGVTATARNWNTVEKLLELAGRPG